MLKTVNKKQFHYLLIKFLMKKRLLHDFISISRKYKLSESYKNTYRGTKFVENFSEDDDASTHLYKCIDVYVENNILGNRNNNLYHGTILGFFRYLPAGVPFSAWNEWKNASQEWENMYWETKYVED